MLTKLRLKKRLKVEGYKLKVMGSVKRFEDLEVWKASMELAGEIYFLGNEYNLDYYLRDQINRAALSISNNIAEGFEYGNNSDFIRFLKYAKGFAGEVRSLLKFLELTKLVPSEKISKLFTDVVKLSKQLSSLINYLRKYSTDKKLKEPIEPLNLLPLTCTCNL